jgi:MOSC domain-containing protein YiiM
VIVATKSAGTLKPMIIRGSVASIHIHPQRSGDPMQSLDHVELVAEKGVLQDPRYFARASQGRSARRQVSLIEREQLAEHAAVLGLKSLPPGIVRSNIETEGLNLIELLGQNIQIGAAILHLLEPRTPCAQMDRIAPGLRQLMENGRQGVIAQVITSGVVQIGDAIAPSR